jgi:hypothetical protein
LPISIWSRWFGKSGLQQQPPPNRERAAICSSNNFRARDVTAQRDGWPQWVRAAAQKQVVAGGDLEIPQHAYFPMFSALSDREGDNLLTLAAAECDH